MLKVGFIGVGNMGKPMATNLLKAGYEVNVFDLNAGAVKEMESRGAHPHPTAAELAAASDVVVCSLPNAKIVELTMLGESGVFAKSKPGTVIMDMSSVSPSTTKAMAKKASEHGLRYMDAPVSGGVSGAEAGTLTIMVGADDETFERVKPILDVLGKKIHHIGGPGAGDAMKVVNNHLFGCNMASLAEALILGVKCGLSVDAMREIISESSGASYALTAKLAKFIQADKFENGFAVDLQYKDLGLALESAREERVPLPMGSAAVQVYEMARAEGHGRDDMSSVVKVWEGITGAKVSGS